MSFGLSATRHRELSLDEVVAKYPRVPRLVALKIDGQRRGVHYTERAEAAIDPAIHQVRSPNIFGTRNKQLKPWPDSLTLRDGGSLIAEPTPLERNPYIVDVVDGRIVLTDDGQVVEEVEYWRKPLYYDKQTSSGKQMSNVITARPQRLNIFQALHCHFWNDGGGCRFCDINNFAKDQKKTFAIPSRPNTRDLSETLGEALKEEGRFTTICMTGGSVLMGEETFDLEVDHYILTLQALGEHFATRRFPSQLIASAFNERQLRRLHEETGLSSYTTDLEVLDERLFEWVCPGKHKLIGYKEWRARLIRAVDIFGRGRVNTGIVGGIELARPHGHVSEYDALKATLEEAEYLAEHGVSTIHTVWQPRPGSQFGDQTAPSLEYYVQLALGLQDLRNKYDIGINHDDYRRCGNHPDSDLARLQ